MVDDCRLGVLGTLLRTASPPGSLWRFVNTLSPLSLTHSFSLSLSLSHTFSLSLSLSHTHTHTHTHTQLTAESVGPFISDSITRNRPRLILFSPHTQPSLLYKSVAFSNRQVADFGFLTTETLSEESQSILKRYNVVLRSKRLLVFKEYPHSSTTLEVCVHTYIHTHIHMYVYTMCVQYSKGFGEQNSCNLCRQLSLEVCVCVCVCVHVCVCG